MPGRYILDTDNNPVPEPDLIRWGRWMEVLNHRRVALDQFEDIRVSTIFLGLDHNWDGGSPILWETRIFGGEHDESQWRYTSHAEAVAGHQKAVDMVRGEKTTPAGQEGA